MKAKPGRDRRFDASEQPRDMRGRFVDDGDDFALDGAERAGRRLGHDHDRGMSRDTLYQADRSPMSNWRTSEHGEGSFADDDRPDADYRHWRAEQIRKLDQDYEEYCKERRQKFTAEFDKWRSARTPSAGAQGEKSVATKR